MDIQKPTPACPEDEAYLAYIDAHRKNVFTAFCRFGQQICLCLSLVGPAYKQLRACVSRHDLSKYENREFGQYRQFFFPADGEEKDKALFDRGWQHHYQNNRHHWEFWLENGKPKPMDKLAIAEMILDWVAMSIHFKTNPLIWYNQNKHKIVFEKRTRETVETVLQVLARTKQYPFSIRRYHTRRPVKKS